MAPQSACARGLVAETLSAWRDRALGQSEMRDIAAHVRTCQRCQHHLAQFDIIGQALQRQRAPNLHDRVWSQVQAGMTTRPRGGGGKQVAVRGGASALAALLVVAIIVITALHANHGTRPPVAATATGYPTATTIPLSTFVPAAQAWGIFPKQTVLETSLSSYPTDILPDGSGFLGQQYNAGQKTLPAIVKVSLPAGNTQILYTPTRDENRTVLGDGRYVIWYGNFVFTGGPGGLPYQSVGYLDTQTGKVTTLITDQQGNIDDSGVYAVDHGYFVWAPITTKGEDLDVTNVANGVTTRIAAINVDKSVPGHDLGMGTDMNMHLSWPYVFYTNTEQQHLYNITSGKDIILDQIKQSNFDFNAFALAGTMLFWMHPAFANTSTMELDMLDLTHQAGALPKLLVAFPRPYKSRTFANLAMLSGLNANSRLVVWSDINGSYAWDRAQGRLVQIYAAAVQHSPASDPSTVEDTRILLHGNELMYMSGSVDTNVTPINDTTAFTFVDTSKLPTAGA